ETSAPDDPGLGAKRPKTLKNPDMKDVPVAETIMKCNMVKSVANSPSNPQAEKQAESDWKEPLSVVPSEVSSQCHGADSQTSEIYPGGAADLGFNLKGNDYESHALNLLADLALGSCIPSFIPRDSEVIAASCSPSSDSAKEQQGHRKHKSLRAASDHEYHRVDKLAKGPTSPSKASLKQNLPLAETRDLNNLASVPREECPGVSSKNSASPIPSTPQALPPRETQEAAEVKKHSFISVEHSYASQMTEHSKKHMYPRGALYPGPAPSRNGSRNAEAGPLVGKVLPFRQQQNSTHPLQPLEVAAAMRCRSSLLSPRLKEDITRSRKVNICGKSLKVTCHWEAEYVFSLDTRYTNDALEKTIIRALHGPWDPDLPDDVEEVKLILHTWLALFYSKPSKLLSSTRKVVEHSNPKKYVSIYSTWDFLELSDDGEDCFELETCPADSRSDPDQTPSSSLDRSTRCQGACCPEESPADSQTDADGILGVVDSTVSSSSGELPCGEEEPSSTSCPESLSLAEDADESLAVIDGCPAVVPEERVPDMATIAVEEPPKDTPGPSDELGNADKARAVLGRESPCSQAPSSSRAPWSDAWAVLRGHGEQQENGWATGSGGGPGPPEGRESTGDGVHCKEVEDGSWAASHGPQPACDSMPLEIHPKIAKPSGASGEGRESQDPSGHPEKEGEEVEEGRKENEDSEYESTVLGPVDLAFSGSGDADMAHEHSEQKRVNSAYPKDFGFPGEGPLPSPAVSASPCPGRSVLDGTETGPWGLPGEMAPSLDTLQEPWEALATPNAEMNGVGLAHTASPAHVGSSRDSRLMLLLPSHPSPVCGAQPDSITGNLGSAGEMLGIGLEQKDKDRAPSAERWAPASLWSPCSQGLSLTLSPDSSFVGLASPDGATHPRAAPEEQEATANIQSPSQSNMGGSSGFSQRCGGAVHAGLASLSTGESNQEGSEVLVEEQRSGPSANRTDALDESSGAGDGQGFPLDPTALAGDSEAGQSDDLCLGAEKSPESDKTNAARVADAPQEPRCAEEVKKDTYPCRAEPSESSPADSLVPGDPGSLPPPPPHGHKVALHSAEPDSVLSVHPKTFSRGTSAAPDSAPRPCCPQCGSPGGQAADAVTILPSDTWLRGLGRHRRRNWHGDSCTPWQDSVCDKRSRARSRTHSRTAPLHLSKLKYDNKLQNPRGDIALILEEYTEFSSAVLSRADAGSEGGGPRLAHREARSERMCTSPPGRTVAFEDMIADLCSTLRFHLHSLAKEACGRTDMFYLVETGKDPFFARVK
ncbi:PREDICTED: uncharacterized protein LOC104510871, partial [Eurypyga helias]